MKQQVRKKNQLIKLLKTIIKNFSVYVELFWLLNKKGIS